MANKTQPGITVDEEVWKQFKEKFNKNASQKVEELMKRSLESDELPLTFSTAGVEHLTFVNPSKWSLDFNDNKIQLTNTLYSCSADITNNHTDSGTVTNISYYTSGTSRDVEIE